MTTPQPTRYHAPKVDLGQHQTYHAPRSARQRYHAPVTSPAPSSGKPGKPGKLDRPSKPEKLGGTDSPNRGGKAAQPGAKGAKAAKPGKPGKRPSPSLLSKAPRLAAIEKPVVLDAAAVAAAEAFGRVAEDGTVYVIEAEQERSVGQVPHASTGSAAMAIYVRRYLDLVGKVNLFETRLSSADLSVREIDATLAKLSEEAAEPAAVGDLVGLRARIAALGEIAAARRAELDAARAAAKAAALARRIAIVEESEALANTDPTRIQWRPAGDQLRQLLEEWKTAQRTGPRIDRPTEDELWKRFSAARTTFDRERRKYFADLDAKNTEAKAAKEAIVAEAEKLATSTDWGATAGAYRDLMTKWKAAGRASRKDDDALWARFRAAQDAFFDARTAANAKVDQEFSANLAAKEELLAQAKTLVPVTDLAAAKKTLRSLQERWETIGKVPRADMTRIESAMRAVEQAVRDAEQAKWVRTNPETRARAEGAAAQLERVIASLEVELAQAQAAGDDAAIAKASAALEARRSWLEQVAKAADDARH